MEFLAAQGYRLPGEDPLRCRFANCLQWFISLNDVSTSRIDAIIQTVRETLVPASRMSGNHFTPAAHCGLQPQDGRNGEMGDVEKEEQATLGKRSREDSDNNESFSSPSSEGSPLERLGISPGI